MTSAGEIGKTPVSALGHVGSKYSPVSPLNPRGPWLGIMASPPPVAALRGAAGCGGGAGSGRHRIVVTLAAKSGCAGNVESGIGLGRSLAAEMWRSAARQLSRSTSRPPRRLPELFQVQQPIYCACCRWKSLAALELQESQGAGWETLQTQRLSFLGESVSALEAPLHSVINLPWIAARLVARPSNGFDDFIGIGGRIGGEHRRPHQLSALAGFADTAELEEEEEEEDLASSPASKVPEGVPGTPGREKHKSRRGRRSAGNESGTRFSKKKYQELYERQKKVEVDAWTAAVANYKLLMEEMCRKKLAPNLPFAQSLMLGWFEPLRKAIAVEHETCKKGEDSDDVAYRSVYAPFLVLLPPDVLAVITMHKLMSLALEQPQNGCVRVVHAALQIAEAVECEVNVRRVLAQPKRKKKVFDDPDSILKETEENWRSGLKERQEEARKEQQELKRRVKKLVKQGRIRKLPEIWKKAKSSEPWGEDIRAKVGSRLLQLMLETAVVRPPPDQLGDDLPEIRPAFRHTSRIYKKNSKQPTRNYGVIEVDPLLYQQLGKVACQVLTPYMPMIVPPRKWTDFRNGAYLVLRSSMMRTHGSKAQYEAIRGSKPLTLAPVFEALDTLGRTAWKINKPVLAVVEKLWEDGGRVASLVDRDNVALPVKPETDDPELIKKWRREMSVAKRINAERHSLRSDTLLKFGVAQKMSEEEVFYYPHNVDFRGRAYPMHPHLNHLGSDVCRGILEFGEGRKLGSDGLRWLKISLASLYGGGVDKLSFDGRVAFVDNNIDKVFDSADHPLDGERWWIKAEDPFQCLAVCMDLKNALMCPKAEEYVSYLPVHQDGSCNGLQHYAALGRDRVGAMSVNLIAGDQPADVYSGIAKRVHAIMERDALEDPAVSRNAVHAKVLVGQVDRKFVKQTVMTSVYGVTFVGARTQIMARLTDRNCLPEGHSVFHAANYAAKVTLNALGEMFKEARCIMGWLGDCAKIIACQNAAVQWTTPLGLPVVQPYRRQGRQMVRTSLQILAIKKENDQPISASRQRSAFPPNFVHSLDGSHMMMTAVACGKAGLSFAGVHDSYWTHAGDVDEMNTILRRTFVELYSRPILEDLLNSFRTQFPTLTFPDLPERGDLDLEEVLKSPYFFN